VRRVGGAPIIYMGYHVPPAAHPDFAAVQLLGLVLGDTPGGRLHKRVVEQPGRRQAFGATLGWPSPAPLLVGAALAPGAGRWPRPARPWWPCSTAWPPSP
jgi:zinc protease